MRDVVGLGVIGAAVGALAYLSGQVESWWATTSVWTGAACVAFVGLLIALGKERSKVVATVVLAVAGVAGLVLAILAMQAGS